MKVRLTTELIEDAIAKKEVYTLSQLVEAWASYNTDKVMKIQQDGKWHIRPVGVGMNMSRLGDGVTGARVETYSNVMSFIRYLEKHYG